ncbi:hypothetical protein KI387_006427, partial [Taxus chinensis]
FEIFIAMGSRLVFVVLGLTVLLLAGDVASNNESGCKNSGGRPCRGSGGGSPGGGGGGGE